MEEQRYADLVASLQAEVAVIEREVRAMEERGYAERHPEKHARALEKLEEINEQIAVLQESIAAAHGSER